MTLIVETGASVVGAESYATTAAIDAYWLARPQMAQAALWAAATDAVKEGAAREATAFLDATYGPSYKGQRRGYIQGRLWPRSNALDEAGYPLPDLPPELIEATCELAGRAVSARLATDAAVDGVVKRTKKQVGPISTEVEYGDGAGRFARYGAIDGLMAPLLDSNPTSGGGHNNWAWA